MRQRERERKPLRKTERKREIETDIKYLCTYVRIRICVFVRQIKYYTLHNIIDFEPEVGKTFAVVAMKSKKHITKPLHRLSRIQSEKVYGVKVSNSGFSSGERERELLYLI